MAAAAYDIHGVKVLAYSPEGKKLRTGRDANDLIAEAYHQEPSWTILPAELFDDAFFELRTGVAGEIVSKFVAFRLRVAIIGDISRYVQESSSLRAFVYESNRGDQVWFLPNIEEFHSRLEKPHS
jgi:Domain of unknown function (DUF4180)